MSERLLAVLLQQALLLSVGAALVRAARPLLLRRLGASSVYAAWLLVPILLLTPLLPRPAQEPLHIVLQAIGTAKPATLSPLPAPPVDHAAIWLALWLGGTVLVGAAQAWRQWCQTRLGLHLPAGSSPALVGLLRPRVALPIDFESRFSAAERQLILAHEEVHRSRGDNAWNLLACLLTALHWWNPLAWWAARRMQADQELACDAAVLSRHPAGRLVYTQALLAAHGLQPPRAPLASRWASTHPLVERIAMLNRVQTLPRRRAATVALALLAVAGLAYAAQSPAPAAVDAATAKTVELKLELSYQTGKGQDRQSYSSKPTLRLPLNQTATVLLNGSPDHPSPDQIAITLKARELGDGKIELQAELQRGEPLVTISRPRLITADGVKALIEQGRDDPSVTEHLSLAITPTLLTPQQQH